jgi:hypothetical protein
VILLHETFQIVHGGLDEFEDAYQNDVAPRVREIDGVEPLWFLRQRTGIEGEFAIALTALRSGTELGSYTAWMSGSEGAAWRAHSQRLTRAFQRKALMAAPWSPFNEWEELAPVLASGATGRRIFMEDTGWPYVSVADYVDFQRREYWEPLQKWASSGAAVVKLWGFFLVAPGSGHRPEAIFLQEVMSDSALERLIGEPEVYDPNTFPGSYMVQGLTYRDQWRSRLMVASQPREAS